MNSRWLLAGVTIVAVIVLALAWWGWRQGGLALLQLGLGIC